MKKETIICAIFSGVMLMSHAADFTVTSDLDDGSEGTLRYLCDTVPNGSTIYIPEGMVITLHDTITTRFRQSIIGLGEGATLYGSGTNQLITGTIPSYSSGNSLLIQNLTLTNGFTTGNGAVFRFGETSWSSLPVHFRDCRIMGNRATGSGGVLNDGGGIFTFTNCVVAGNTAASGGVIGYNNVAYSVSGEFHASNTVFHSNSATNGAGGVFGKSWGRLRFTDCVVSNNTSTANGGVAAANGSATSTVFENCRFVDNAAGGTGGMFAGVGTGSTGTLFTNCVIRGHSARMGSVFNDCGKTVFVGTLIEGNVNTGNGGWYSAGMMHVSNGAPSYYFTNCVVRANINQAGGNVLVWVHSPGTSASIIARNTFFEGNYGTSGPVLTESAMLQSFDSCTFVGNGNDVNSTLIQVSGSRSAAFTNCTFYANRTTTAIVQYPAASTASASITGCTVVSNSLATGTGYAAIRNLKGDTADFRIINTVAAHNTMANGTIADLYGAISVLRHSAFTQDAGTQETETNLFGLTEDGLKFGEFGENETTIRLHGGEPLPTLEILRRSVLRNAGSLVDGLVCDARNAPRDELPDIGAYEFIDMTHPTILLIR